VSYSYDEEEGSVLFQVIGSIPSDGDKYRDLFFCRASDCVLSPGEQISFRLLTRPIQLNNLEFARIREGKFNLY